MCLCLRESWSNKALLEMNDYHLQPTSKAIGAGVYLSEVPTDFDGKLRPNPPACGAYEYQLATTPPQTVPSPSGAAVK